MIRLAEAGRYNAFPMATSHGDTAHIFFNSGTGHVERFTIGHYWSDDGFETAHRGTVLASPDVSFGDIGGGWGSDGYFYLFSAVLKRTGGTEYGTHTRYEVYRSRDLQQWDLAATNLPCDSGDEGGWPYGRLQVLPSGLMLHTVYGKGTAFCIQSANGMDWTVRSQFRAGDIVFNETCMQIVDGSTDADTVIVALSRCDSHPHMFISRNGGASWEDCGAAHGSSTRDVSPWLEKLPNGDIVYFYADRTPGVNLLCSFEYDADVLLTSTDNSDLSRQAFLGKTVHYESVVNQKAQVHNVGAHFGYPTTFYQGGELYFVSDDLDPAQQPPHAGLDPVQVDLIVRKYDGNTGTLGCDGQLQAVPQAVGAA